MIYLNFNHRTIGKMNILTKKNKIMNIQKERRLLKLALSKKTNPEKIKNRMIEILMEDITPMDLINQLSESKTRWSKEPLRPNIKPSRFSINEALKNIKNDRTTD